MTDCTTIAPLFAIVLVVMAVAVGFILGRQYEDMKPKG